MCIRNITHWLPCCHQRCTSIGLCSDAVVIRSTTTSTKAEKAMATENPDNEEATKTEDMSSFNPIDCPARGPVFSDQASEEACPVCKEVEVDAKAGDNGHQEGEEAEMLAALGWESYFDRYG
jgi:hypothetical protein